MYTVYYANKLLNSLDLCFLFFFYFFLSVLNASDEQSIKSKQALYLNAGMGILSVGSYFLKSRLFKNVPEQSIPMALRFISLAHFYKRSRDNDIKKNENNIFTYFPILCDAGSMYAQYKNFFSKKIFIGQILICDLIKHHKFFEINRQSKKDYKINLKREEGLKKDDNIKPKKEESLKEEDSDEKKLLISLLTIPFNALFESLFVLGGNPMMHSRLFFPKKSDNRIQNNIKFYRIEDYYVARNYYREHNNGKDFIRQQFYIFDYNGDFIAYLAIYERDYENSFYLLANFFKQKQYKGSGKLFFNFVVDLIAGEENIKKLKLETNCYLNKAALAIYKERGFVEECLRKDGHYDLCLELNRLQKNNNHIVEAEKEDIPHKINQFFGIFNESNDKNLFFTTCDELRRAGVVPFLQSILDCFQRWEKERLLEEINQNKDFLRYLRKAIVDDTSERLFPSFFDEGGNIHDIYFEKEPQDEPQNDSLEDIKREFLEILNKRGFQLDPEGKKILSP